ncbi:hypothetical protein SODALDRAFT_338275 [Sodiomyces alkalinus F11]|uniref:Large ribosomal subunit protein mL46 n=1 Tax=Sodiomyces alkalinus (strain CBS 110278 / VKM F-3762 / F11) TaxID=1314773 RepID=A0A3N2Q1C8_SODAK|nr:hypothetical protein SODALDRAFT_338275 [Sodiomyces alkalinus F11]ROT40498.1 hypothetical protein SODALDRAFT_338275 [Sodiomyces alkalinus F11]
MSASSRGANIVRSILRTSPNVCRRCARGSIQIRFPAANAFSLPSSRPYSGAAAASVTTSNTPIDPPTASNVPLEPVKGSAKQHYRIKSGIILTRAPLLTAEPTSFESSFYFYQKRLNERLCMPFVTSVFFKPDTPALIDWNLKVKDRKGTVAKELGIYNGKASRAWDDELKVGDPLSKYESLHNALLKDAEMRVSDDAEIIPEEDRVPVEKPQDRVSEADKTGDVRRLDRAMDRTLYLVVKGKDGNWAFLSSSVATDENLHETAKRVLDQGAGVNMNTWIVGRVPVAHHVVRPVFNEDGTLESRGEKTFYLKGRIMAGQANLEGNPFGYTDFKWLTREELQSVLEPRYFHSVRNMMADR